jgi:hypothetical protein
MNVRDCFSGIAAVCFIASLHPVKALQAPKGGATLEQDLKLLAGTWYPAKNEAKLREFAIDIQIRKATLLIQYIAPGGGNMVQIKGFESGFELKQTGDKRRIVPTKKNAGISEITYRLEKGRLVIEEGTAGDKVLKGVWERGKSLVP